MSEVLDYTHPIKQANWFPKSFFCNDVGLICKQEGGRYGSTAVCQMFTPTSLELENSGPVITISFDDIGGSDREFVITWNCQTDRRPRLLRQLASSGFLLGAGTSAIDLFFELLLLAAAHLKRSNYGASHV